MNPETQPQPEDQELQPSASQDPQDIEAWVSAWSDCV